MRALADRAGVSLVTPYNLFGSKPVIMYQLLDEDLSRYGAQLSRSKQDPLDILFWAVTLGRKNFAAEASYYKAVMAAVYNEGNVEFRSVFRGPRRALWRSLIEQAIESGYLRSGIDARVFANTLTGIFSANILDWVAGGCSLQIMEYRTHYGFALVLHGAVNAKYRQRLNERVQATQTRLLRYDR